MKAHEMKMQPRPVLQAQQPSRKLQIPNLITLARVVLAIVFVWILASINTRSLHADPTAVDRLGDLTHASTAVLVTAAALFIIAALTDALDGHLARKWKAESKFGRIMDPFADKFLVLGAFIMLAGPGFTSAAEGIGRIQVSAISGWMAVAMVARELLVTSIRGAYESDGVDFSAGWSGKAKMILQSVAVPAILLVIAFGNPAPDTNARTFLVLLAWATTVVTVLSAFPYIGRALQHTVEQQRKLIQAFGNQKTRKPTANPSPKSNAKPRRSKAKGGQGKGRR
ncbi:MAG: CDP-diacylglycerol--glycerol-3-phosphate 3-phosphatidyltransferase [Planctomycetota bacterium]